VGGNEVTKWDPVSLTWKKETLEGVKSVEKINDEWLAWPVDKGGDYFRPLYKFNIQTNIWEKFIPKRTTIEIPQGSELSTDCITLKLNPIDEKKIKRMKIKDEWDKKSQGFIAPFGIIDTLKHEIKDVKTDEITGTYKYFSAIVRQVIKWPHMGYNPMHPGINNTIFVVLEAVTNAGDSQFFINLITDQLGISMSVLVNSETGSIIKGIPNSDDALNWFNNTEALGQQIVMEIFTSNPKYYPGTEQTKKTDNYQEKIYSALSQNTLFNPVTNSNDYNIITDFRTLLPVINKS